LSRRIFLDAKDFLEDVDLLGSDQIRIGHDQDKGRDSWEDRSAEREGQTRQGNEP
jgi:hypothetical protein